MINLKELDKKLINNVEIDKNEQEELLKSCNSENIETIYYMVRNHKDKFKHIFTNINEFKKIVISINNAQCIYYFARDYHNILENIKDLETALVNTHDAEFIFSFAKNIEGADINLAYKAMLSADTSKDNCAEYMSKFFNELINKIDPNIIKFSDIKKAICKTNKKVYINKINKILENYDLNNNENLLKN